MSRSGYSEDYDDSGLLFRCSSIGAASAIRGERGQMLLRGMLKALDAMPVKELIAEELVAENGAVCALGAVAVQADIKTDDLDPEDAERVAKRFGIAECLAREVTYENDEQSRSVVRVVDADGRVRFRDETPAERWARMRAWVVRNLAKEQET